MTLAMAPPSNAPNLERLADGLWTAAGILPLPGGVRMPVRMTVVRLADGGLWVHSPLQPDDALVAAVTAEGPVRHLVAPNLLHHLKIGRWSRLFPEAAVHGAPGLDRKRKDVRWSSLLSDEVPAAWGDTLDQVHVGGSPKIAETVFFHRASRSLIVADFVFNLVGVEGFMTRLLFRMTGVEGRLAQSRLWRLYARDRRRAAASLERILAWPIDRLVPAHGAVIEHGASAPLAAATKWMASAGGGQSGSTLAAGARGGSA